MLSIFSPKKHLVDLFDDFVDIHNHLIPGIDDGAKSAEESVLLIQEMQTLGITNFICTPHTMNEYYPNTPETINNAKGILLRYIKENNIGIGSLKSSSEYMMDVNFIELLKSNSIVPLNKEYILVEMSYLQPPINLEEILFEISNSGYKAVLAHPERYNYLHNKYSYYEKLKKLGCFFQLNMLSLSAHYGSSVKNTTLKLLKDGFYDFIGSDTHHINHLKLLKSLKISTSNQKKLESLVYNTNSRFR